MMMLLRDCRNRNVVICRWIDLYGMLIHFQCVMRLATEGHLTTQGGETNQREEGYTEGRGYATAATRGDAALRLWRAGRLTVTNS